MFAQLLGVVLSLLVNAPAPERLDDPLTNLTREIPEGRVLVAEASDEGERPQQIRESLGPVLQAPAYIVVDLGSGAVLTSREPSAVRPVASLAKLLTALTVVRQADPEDIVTVSARAVRAGRKGADMDLVAGEPIRVQDLLAGLLIPSANDAAVALAEHVGGSEAAFATLMSATADTLGLSRTRVENATGFDSLAQFSSAYDVALLVAEAWKDPVLGVLLRTEKVRVASVDGRQRHLLQTTNRLLGIRSDVLGGKTGFTDDAGESLAVVAESPDPFSGAPLGNPAESRSDSLGTPALRIRAANPKGTPGGHPVVAVVLGSPDRFADMENLLNWTFWAYTWSP